MNDPLAHTSGEHVAYPSPEVKVAHLEGQFSMLIGQHKELKDNVTTLYNKTNETNLTVQEMSGEVKSLTLAVKENIDTTKDRLNDHSDRLDKCELDTSTSAIEKKINKKSEVKLPHDIGVKELANKAFFKALEYVLVGGFVFLILWFFSKAAENI